MKQAFQPSVSSSAHGAVVTRPVPFPSTRGTAKQDALACVLRDAKDIGNSSELAEVDFLDAVRMYQSGKWQRAFEQVSNVADEGNAAAAKLALLMMRCGSSLYGMGFAAQTTRIARWAQVVIGRTMRRAHDKQSMPLSKFVPKRDSLADLPRGALNG